jgi:hypothetical protein
MIDDDILGCEAQPHELEREMAHPVTSTVLADGKARRERAWGALWAFAAGIVAGAVGMYGWMCS